MNFLKKLANKLYSKHKEMVNLDNEKQFWHQIKTHLVF